jgi:hypothetical protein
VGADRRRKKCEENQKQKVQEKFLAISGNCRLRLKNGRESYEYRND